MKGTYSIWKIKRDTSRTHSSHYDAPDIVYSYCLTVGRKMPQVDNVDNRYLLSIDYIGEARLGTEKEMSL